MKGNNSMLNHDFGGFEGFNFRDNGAIPEILTSQDVIDWDHDENGEAEFWPDGENEEVRLLFKGRSSVGAGELLALDKLLSEIGDDSVETYLKIYHCLNNFGYDLESITCDMVEDNDCMIFTGNSFTGLRQEVAYELFEMFYPEEYAVWEKSLCDGLIFDEDRFMDSPTLSVTEIRLKDQVALLVTFN